MNCPNCKQPEHYGKCRFVYGRAVAPVAPVTCRECAIKDATIRALQARLDLLESRPVTTIGTSLTIESNGFDKKAYQREYMRNRRAQQKQPKER